MEQESAVSCLNAFWRRRENELIPNSADSVVDRLPLTCPNVKFSALSVSCSIFFIFLLFLCLFFFVCVFLHFPLWRHFFFRLFIKTVKNSSGEAARASIVLRRLRKHLSKPFTCSHPRPFCFRFVTFSP